MSNTADSYIKRINRNTDVEVIKKLVREWKNRVADKTFTKDCLQGCYNLVLKADNIDRVLAAGAGNLCISAMNAHSTSPGIQWRGLRFIKHITRGVFALAQSGGADVVLRAMERFPRDENVQNYGLRAVRALALIQPNAEYLVQENIADRIRKAMKNFINKTRIQKSAITAINALLKTDEIKTMLFKRGLANYVINAMNNHPDDTKILYSALITLMEIGVEYGQIQLRAHECVLGAMERHKGDQKIVQNGCATIKALSTLEFNVEVLLEKGVVKTLLSCLEHHFENPKIQEIGCLAFWSLGLWEDKKRTLHDFGVGNYIISVCIKYRSNRKVLGNAFSVLNNLATEQRIAVDLVHLNVIEFLLDGAKVTLKSEHVQERFISAIRTFADCEQAVSAMRRADIKGSIEEAIQAHPGNNVIRKKGDEVIDIL